MIVDKNGNKIKKHKKWINFYWDQNEIDYFSQNTYKRQWKHLVKQSNALWSATLKEVNGYKKEQRPVIFEGVNLLPHLVFRYLEIPCVVLIGKSHKETLERNKKDPRWGNTLKLQTLEADAFFYGQRSYYTSEAKKYGYPVFETADDAFDTAKDLLLNGDKSIQPTKKFRNILEIIGNFLSSI